MSMLKGQALLFIITVQQAATHFIICIYLGMPLVEIVNSSMPLSLHFLCTGQQAVQRRSVPRFGDPI